MIERCESGEYEEKTIMFCWEHKNIPYIVAKFGFAKKDLTWGLNPKRGVRLTAQCPECALHRCSCTVYSGCPAILSLPSAN